LDNKIFDIIDARCNHEDEQNILIYTTVLGNIKIVRVRQCHIYSSTGWEVFSTSQTEKCRATLQSLKVQCEAVSPCM